MNLEKKEEATVPTKSTPAQASQSAELEKKVENLSSECFSDSQLVKTKEELAEKASPTEKKLKDEEGHASGSGLRLEGKGSDQPPEEQACVQPSPATQEGYDYTLVDKSLQNEDGMQCLICHLIPRVPAKVDCCGLIFCHACITAHTNKHKNAVCPHCNATDFTWMIDKLLERKINNFQVYCVNLNKGCNWTGDLHYLQEHLQEATNNGGRCDYVIVQCEACGEDVMYGKLDKHVKDVCRHRRIPCEYEFAGCEFECPEVDMPKHIEKNVAKHLSLVTKQLRRNTEQIRGNTEHIQDHDFRIQAKYQVFINILVICLVVVVFLVYIHPQLWETETGHSDQLQSIDRRLKNISLNFDTVMNDIIVPIGMRLDNISLNFDTVMNDIIELSKRVRSSEFAIQGLKYNLSRNINQLHAELVDISHNMTLVMEDASENLESLNRDVQSTESAVQTLQFDGRDMHSNIQDNKLAIHHLKKDIESLKQEVKTLESGITTRIDEAYRWVKDTIQRFIPFKLHNSTADE